MELHQVLISTEKRSILRLKRTRAESSNCIAIQDLDAESVEVTCMARIGHNRYFWPRINDIIWYSWNDVIMPISESSHVTGMHCLIDQDKFKAIEAIVNE
ncbi:hypothetical protein MAR_028889 [Mya arenaria]|uniref:Uncharacterized protein n=1 Tax=Mya arenaria TaxID=6604 RepID=A0ABY7DI90_MYAAR|nr:hypothetical protein MAR_028889 [Mya arenaria]